MTEVGESIIPVKTTCSTCEALENGQTEGHPIDVATGRVFTVAKDLCFPRPFMLKIFRTWLSTNKDSKGLFGLGWSTLLDTRVKIFHNDITYYDDEYQCIEFPKIDIGETCKIPSMGVTLVRQEHSMEVTDSQGRTFHFAMDAEIGQGTLEWITKNGIDLIYLEYDQGLLCAIKDPAGNHYPIQRDHKNRVIGILRQAPGENPVKLRGYGHDEKGRLNRVWDEMGHTTGYRYNDDNLLIQETDRNGFSFYYEYDSADRCVKNVGDSGKYLREFEYQPVEHKTVVTDSHGHKKTYYYKHAGLVEMTVDALGQIRQRHHDKNGYLIGEIDKNKNVINYQNDNLGREIKRVDQENNKWRTDYGPHGDIKSDPLGNAITQTRDSNANLIREQDQNGHFLEYHYNHKNQKIVRPGNDKHREYDAWNRLVRQTDAMGHGTRQTYDLKGRLTAQYDALGHCTAYAYDAEDNVHTLTDPLGYQQRLIYKDNNELVEQIDGNNNRIGFSYNQEGNLTQITDPNNETHILEYDPLDRILKDTGFDGQANGYTYDPEGNIIRVDKADDSVFCIDYNKVNQPVKIKAIDLAGTISRNYYTYDPAGRLILAENEHSIVRLEYDALGRVTGEYQNEYFIENVYDTAGNLIIRKSASGPTTEFKYDARNRLEYVILAINKHIRIVRDAVGRPRERHLPGNIHSQCSHDPTGQLLTQAIYTSSDKEPRLMAGRKYTWDQRGKLINLEDETRGAKRFTYDPAGQVIDVRSPHKPDEKYMFDPCGNIAEGACAGGNRQEALNGKKYRYDQRGNEARVTGNSTTCTRSFNVFNQLASVDGPNDAHTEFLYDAFGRRILKKNRFQETRFYWDQYRLAGEETDQSKTDYIYYPNTFVPLCCLKDGSSYFYQTDHLGTPMEITNEHGELVWLGHYDTFGRCHVDETATFENNIRFQGQYHDSETGLHYNCFRYYDPETGRYISQDPISYLSGDFNLYRYCFNDPVNLVDPLGFGIVLSGFALGSLLLAITGGLIAQQHLAKNLPKRKIPEDPFPTGRSESSSNNKGKCVKKPGGEEESKEEDKVEELINDKETKPGEDTKGRSEQYERPGGIEEANEDFNNLDPQNVQERPKGVRSGELNDGRKVNVRPKSKDGRPTLEIIKPNNRRIKIRYGP